MPGTGRPAGKCLVMQVSTESRQLDMQRPYRRLRVYRQWYEVAEGAKLKAKLLPNSGLVEVAGAHPPLPWSARHASALDGRYQALMAVMFQEMSLPGD